MAKNTFTVIGGKTTEQDKDKHDGANGMPGVRYYHTLSDIAAAWKAANPEDRRSVKEIQLAIAHANHLKDPVSGKDCTGHTIQNVVITNGQVLTLPAGNPVTEVKFHYDCPPRPAPSAQTPVAAPPPVAAPAPAPETATVPVVPAAQFMPMSADTLRDNHNADTVMFFVGEPPKSATARWKGERDRTRDGLAPGIQEGRIANTNPDTPFKKIGEALNYVSPDNKLVLSRGKEGQEIVYGPGQHVLLDKDGKPIDINPENPHLKVESGVRLGVDWQGAIRTVGDNHALISQNRRENPDDTTRRLEQDTAGTRAEQLTNTTEGQLAVVTYLGIERAHQQFTSTKADAQLSPEETRKRLELYTQAALHPLVWSEYNYGVPVMSREQIRQQITDLTAKLPEGDETKKQFDHYATLLENPGALDAAIKSDGGRTNWYNPMVEWANERQQLDFIREGYGRVPLEKVQNYSPTFYGEDSRAGMAPRGAKELDEAYHAETVRVSQLYAQNAWQQSIRPSLPTEIKLGTGLLHDAKAQTEENLSKARVDTLKAIAADDTKLDAMAQVLNKTPGGWQNAIDLLHFSSNTSSGNYRLLDYKDAADARQSAESIATALLGATEGKALMHEEGSTLGNIGRGIVKIPSIGTYAPVYEGNYEKGLQAAKIIQQRYDDPATRPQVLAALKSLAERAADAEGKAPGNVASTALILSLAPKRAEKAEATPELDALFNKIGTEGAKAIHDQSVVNQDLAGHANVTAELMKRAAARGKDGTAVTVDRTVVAGVAAGATLVALPADQAKDLTSGKPVVATVLPTNAQAQKAIKGFQTADSQLVSQEALNASIIQDVARRSPATFATALVGSITAAMRDGKPEKVAALQATVATLRDNQGSAGKELASLISDQVHAVISNKGSAEAATTSYTAFEAFFASKKDAKVNAIAAGTLANKLATSPAASTAFGDSLQSLNTALAGALPAGALDQLNAAATIADPAARTAALQAFAGQFGDQVNSIAAGRGYSIESAIELALLGYALRPRHAGGAAADNPALKNGPVPSCPGASCSVIPAPVPTPPPALPTIPGSTLSCLGELAAPLTSLSPGTNPALYLKP